MKLKALSLAGIFFPFAIVPASAHHSYAMFDPTRTLTVSGTVISFQWTNPHSWLDVAVQNGEGREEKWAFELGSPAALARQGLKPKSILPGDRVTVTHHPLKDGTTGGALVSAKFAKGLTFGEGAQAQTGGRPAQN